MGIRNGFFSSIVAGSLLAFGAGSARAAAPVVLGVGEAVAAEGNGRVILVYGTGVNRMKTWTLSETSGPVVSPLTILFKSKTLVALQYPANLTSPAYPLPGNYALSYTFGTSGVGTVGVRLTGGFFEAEVVGASALTAPLLTDLNDADTVGGETAAQLHDWGLLTGVPSGFADGIDDGTTYLAGAGLQLTADTFSVSFGGTGLANSASRSDHDHDLRYYTQTQLNSTGGVVNAVGNPVDWSRIKGMPAGFADGVDDGGGGSFSAGEGLTLTSSVFSVNFSGTGSASTASRSDHDHDLRYYTEAELNTTGTINNAGNPVDWTRLKGVPAGFADGVDTDTTYTAGTGLSLTSGAFAVLYSGSGSASTSSRSDHDHATTYLDLTGGTVTGTITISNSSGQAISATSGSTSSTTGGIDCTTAGGVGVAGHGDIGVYGDLDSDGTWGVAGKCAYSYQVGVYAYANSGYGDSSSAALFAYHYWNGPGVVGKTYSGIGVYGFSNGYGYTSAVGVKAVAGSYGTSLLVNHYGSYGELAVFQSYGTNYARIDLTGKGFFNGGTQTYGADFAESVKVDRPKAEFEPGDVMVIDTKAPRQFSLSREAESPLVAGVVSTKPAVIGTTHDVARRTPGIMPSWMKEEVVLGVVGIVPTKVCDEGGPIRIGDLLVTSSVPGTAKRGPPSPAVGTVIGKALGALDRGKGKIEVLLMAR